MRSLNEADLADLALGSAILGSGGGGHPYVGMLLAREAIREHGPVEVVEVDDIADDALVVPAAMMGAPTILVEKLPSGDEIVSAFEALEEYFGRSITHTVAIEIGGVNSMIPIATAARTGVPLIDADFMGRAFPELQMCTPTLSGLAATPMAMADEKGNSVILNTKSNLWTERIARSVTVEMGCASLITIYPMSGAQLKQSAVPGTLRLAQEVGRTVREQRAEHGDPAAAVCESLGGVELFQGKVADIARRTAGGFARAEALIKGVGDDAGSALTILTQNEHLVASRDGEVVATTPDLIIVLDSDTGDPITTEDLRYGFRVTVLGAPCDSRWRTADGLALVGPRYFGYDIDYVPVEDRQRSRRRRPVAASVSVRAEVFEGHVR